MDHWRAPSSLSDLGCSDCAGGIAVYFSDPSRQMATAILLERSKSRPRSPTRLATDPKVRQAAGRLALTALLLLTPALAGAEVYRWVDSEGVTHYSDEPRIGAERIDPGEPSVIPMAPDMPRAASGRDPAEGGAYRRFAIVRPEPDATLRGHPGDVNVALALEPGLRGGHSLTLLLDGEPAPRQPGDSLQVVLPSMPRGTHTLQARIENQDGRVVAETDRVTFYMHRPSVNLPARSGSAN